MGTLVCIQPLVRATVNHKEHKEHQGNKNETAALAPHRAKTGRVGGPALSSNKDGDR
jgi:hypothetical protein